MRISDAIHALTFAICVSGAVTAAATPALAFDPTAEAAAKAADASPARRFVQGFRAYQRGDKVEAVEELTSAADGGHPGARWKLGEMYAKGDGVPEDDFAAFNYYRSILRDQNRRTSDRYTDTAYVASAVVALGNYWRTGIPNSPIAADPRRARQYYFHAASYFGDVTAQFVLGQMVLNGEGGPAKPRQAARWLKLAMQKGCVGAKALLGSLLVDGARISMPAQPVRGLTMLTTALDEAAEGAEREWVAGLQADAMASVSPADRELAIANARQQIAMARKPEDAAAAPAATTTE